MTQTCGGQNRAQFLQGLILYISYTELTFAQAGCGGAESSAMLACAVRGGIQPQVHTCFDLDRHLHQTHVHTVRKTEPQSKQARGLRYVQNLFVLGSAEQHV